MTQTEILAFCLVFPAHAEDVSDHLVTYTRGKYLGLNVFYQYGKDHVGVPILEARTSRRRYVCVSVIVIVIQDLRLFMKQHRRNRKFVGWENVPVPESTVRLIRVPA